MQNKFHACIAYAYAFVQIIYNFFRNNNADCWKKKLVGNVMETDLNWVLSQIIIIIE